MTGLSWRLERNSSKEWQKVSLRLDSDDHVRNEEKSEGLIFDDVEERLIRNWLGPRTKEYEDAKTTTKKMMCDDEGRKDGRRWGSGGGRKGDM